MQKAYFLEQFKPIPLENHQMPL